MQQEDTMLKRGMRDLARATLITLTLGNVCLAWAARADVANYHIQDDHKGSNYTGNQSQAPLNEMANGFTEPDEGPSQNEEPSTAGNQTRSDKQPNIDAHHAGKDRHNLDRRQMSESRGHEHEEDRVFARRRSQLLKCFELSVERQYGLGYLAIGEVSQVITRNSARRRSQRRDQRIAVCSLRDRQRHWHKKY